VSTPEQLNIKNANFEIKNDEDEIVAKIDGESGAALFGKGSIELGADGSAAFGNEKNVFNADGSFSFANNNFLYDLIDGLAITGKFESNANGNKIVIDPKTRNLRMYNSAGLSVIDMSFYDLEQESSADMWLYSYRNNIEEGSIRMFGGRLIISGKNGTIMDISDNLQDYKMYFFINPDRLPQSRNETFNGGLYRNGEDLRIRIG
jgi:hypothetical protein